MESEFINNAKQYIFKNLEETIKLANRKLQALDACNDLLSSLPVHEYMSLDAYSNAVYVNYHPDTNEGAEQIRSEIQVILHQPAKRDFNTYYGSVSYTFFKDIDDEHHHTVHIRISSGKPAPNCQIEEVTETVTRFKMICPENGEPEVVEELG